MFLNPYMVNVFSASGATKITISVPSSESRVSTMTSSWLQIDV